MNRLIHCLSLAVFALVLVACASEPVTQSKQTKTLDDYQAAIRWNEFEQAWQFLDPVFRQTHPLSDLDRERFKQVEIAGYEIKSREQTEGSVSQRVEIRLIDKPTQTERIIHDNQQWRWDVASKHLWLISGLPDLGK